MNDCSARRDGSRTAFESAEAFARLLVSRLDAVIFDVGGTLVEQDASFAPVSALVPRLCPFVSGDLERLGRWLPLGVASNTSVMTGADLRRLLGVAGIERHFGAIVTSCDVHREKPDPKMLQVVASRLGAKDPSRCLFVGDRSTDKEAARRANMAFSWATPMGAVASISSWLLHHYGE